MGELDRCGCDNNKWIWIIVIILLFSGGLGGCGGTNFLDELKCGNNSWIWILVLILLFSGDGFFK